MSNILELNQLIKVDHSMLDISGDCEEFDCGASGLLSLGTIQWMSDKDKYDNQVSLISLPDGQKFRMVHHTNKWDYRYATVYGGYKKFMKFIYRGTENDCATNDIELGGYKMSWGDGDPIHIANHPDGPDLTTILNQIHESNYSRTLFILNVLSHAGLVDACWSRR